MLPEGYARLRLLFVDDAAHTRLLLREILRSRGLSQIKIVESAAAAFAAIVAQPPDIVFTDWEMPERSSIELIHDIRERPSSPDPLLPVILLTANSDTEHVIAARDAGASGYVMKPITLGHILERVVDVVTKPNPFVFSAGYKGPERRGVARPSGPDDGGSAFLALAPDGLLQAKVRGDWEAFRVALARRAEAIEAARRVIGHTAVTPLPATP
jgi:CheY-like chemotaxis protein